MAKEDEKVSENIEETAGNTEESTENVAKETQLDTRENELNIFADQLKEKEAELDKREKEIAKREAELDKREKSLTKKEPKPAAVSFVFNGENYRFTDDAPSKIRIDGFVKTQQAISQDEDILLQLVVGGSGLIEKV